MPQILSSSAWQEFRGKPKNQTLNESAIHFAIVKDAQGKRRKCAVKFVDLSARPGLICEGLGWLLAGATDVHIPEFAAVLMVPIAKLSGCMAVPSFLSNHTEYPAWCVEIVDGSSVAQLSKWAFWLERGKHKCLEAENTAIMASFDYWVDNQDRNYGNVIKGPDGRYIAIDHEALLHALLYKPYGMNFELRSLLNEAEARMKPARFLKFKCDMAVAANKHEVAITNMKIRCISFLNAVLPGATQSADLWKDVEIFLDERCQKGWMSDELKVTV